MCSSYFLTVPNTLDYSAYTTAVTVDLTSGIATGVGGGVLHIQNVIGGAGDDLLIGDAEANLLDGGPGNDRLRERRG